MLHVLMVTRNLPPLVGGMEKLNHHVLVALSRFCDVMVSGPAGCTDFVGERKVVEFSTAPLWRFVVESFWKTLRGFFRQKIDVVFCGSGAAILAGSAIAKMSSARLVCYLHGLDIVAAHPVYRFLFLPLIRRSDIIIVNSRHSRELAVSQGILPAKITVINPGVELPDMSKKPAARKQFREQYSLGSDPVVLIAGRMTHRKGIPEFIRQVMPKLLSIFPELKLVVVGSEAANAIKHNAGATSNIQRAIFDLGLEKQVILVGAATDSALACAYFAADIMAFPVLELAGDVEGFGMVAIEAAAHGLPTVAFAVGGVPDAVGNQQSGWLVPAQNYEEMARLISVSLSRHCDNVVSGSSCIEFASRFSWLLFEDKLRTLLLKPD